MSVVYMQFPNPAQLSAKVAQTVGPESGISYSILNQWNTPHFSPDTSSFFRMQTTETAWPYGAESGVELIVPAGPRPYRMAGDTILETRVRESGGTPFVINPEGLAFLKDHTLPIPTSLGARIQAKKSLECYLGPSVVVGNTASALEKIWPSIDWLVAAEKGCAPWDLSPELWVWEEGIPMYIGGDPEVSAWERFKGSPAAMLGTAAVGIAALYFWSK